MSDFWHIKEVPYDPTYTGIDLEAELSAAVAGEMLPVEVASRRLIAKWSEADVQALKTTHNLDLEQELCDILQQEIRKEWEAENGMTYEQHDDMIVQQLVAIAKQHGMIPTDPTKEETEVSSLYDPDTAESIRLLDALQLALQSEWNVALEELAAPSSDSCGQK